MQAFDTYVAGIPCQCQPLDYQPPIPMRITGTGMGDAEPPEPEEFEFRILDRSGRPAPWLERKLEDADAERLKQEFKNELHQANQL